MLIGVDFDNTIVAYDVLFWNVAREQGLIPDSVPVAKNAIRDHLRDVGMEQNWIELQGYVYGARMGEAVPYPGSIEFFKMCQSKNIPLRIISHKTQRPYAGPQYDLHRAARQWLEQYRFHDADGVALSRDHVSFHPTKKSKIACIRQQQCTVFIDDLPEIFDEPEFPTGVEKILFSPVEHSVGTRHTADHRCQSWTEIELHVLKSIQPHASD